ncbi:ring canal kelch homolog [Aphis gossypii]|uniref:ring canal kelch homolog n=1 Tax=Aphis gossypii TaxID=80765 RepID=UPI0021597F95|nr:ring canal kelch homolog [Aphis gossypii]
MPVVVKIHNTTRFDHADTGWYFHKKKEMDDTVMENSTCESNDQKEIMTFKRCEQKTYKNSSHMVGVFEVLQSLRKDKVLCDIRIETDDGTIIFGHKVVFISVSTYFSEIFIDFNESNIDHINIRELDSNILQLLINYIYTGEIIITKGYVKVLLAAANLLQIDYVKNVCSEFLQIQLDASNCLSIKAFADLYDCMELSTSSQTYIKNRFLEVVNYDEFLSLTSVEVIKLISCNDIIVPLEEKVFECVIHWLKHELDSRKSFLPELMEHVRLPLISKQYLLEKVVDEPLLKSSPKCKDYINESLQFHLLKYLQPFTVSQTIRSTPRQSIGFQKVILMLYFYPRKSSVTYWYDNIWQPAPTMSKWFEYGRLTVINDQFVLAMGSVCLGSSCVRVKMLDISSQSPSWIPMMDMLVNRKYFGVGSLDNCVYAIGGRDGDTNIFNNAEVFDTNTNKWKMVISNMSTKRYGHGVGVLNNLLYVVGGYDGNVYLNTVECYDPCLDTWTPVAAMSECRFECGVGVLDGVLYVIGGYNKSKCFNSVEAYTPSSGVWTTIADMHFCRRSFGVVILNGLLHVIGGCFDKNVVNSIEIYNPKTNTWSLKALSKNVGYIYGGVVVNRPSHFKTYDD